MEIDRDRLSKLMMLTTSDFDGEALSALRMANQMLAKAKLNWDAVLKKDTTTELRPKEQWGNAPKPEPHDPSLWVTVRSVLIDLGCNYKEVGDLYFSIYTRMYGSIDYYPETGRAFVNGKWKRWSVATLAMHLQAG